jgi:hypothetical protein
LVVEGDDEKGEARVTEGFTDVLRGSGGVFKDKGEGEEDSIEGG